MEEKLRSEKLQNAMNHPLGEEILSLGDSDGEEEDMGEGSGKGKGGGKKSQPQVLPQVDLVLSNYAPTFLAIMYINT